MRIPKWIWPLLPISLWLQSGCVMMSPEQYDAFRGRLFEHERKLIQLRGVAKQVEHLSSIVGYCSDEEQQLLAGVQKACQSGLVCSSTSIPIEVLKVDPYHQGRFMTLLSGRKHALFYFPAEGREMNEPEMKRLRDLVAPAWLDDGVRRTRFLVVAHPEDGREGSRVRAEKRAKYVIDTIGGIAVHLKRMTPELMKLPPEPAPSTTLASANVGTSASEGEPKKEGDSLSAPLSPDSTELIRNGRVLYWIFPFSNAREKTILPPEDRPTQPGDQINRSVAVYRVDC